MILSRKTTILYSLLIFASGSVLGALTHRLYTVSSVSAVTQPQGPDEWRKKYIEEMQSRLHLTNDQNLKLTIYLDETRSRVREAHAKAKPEVEQIKREQREKIRLMLDPNQQAEYKKLTDERDQRDRQKQNGPGI
jgi:hypothetical protein